MPSRAQRRFLGTVCFLLALLLLVLALFKQIGLSSVEDEINGLRRERAELERENGIMIVRLAERQSLSEIDRRAEEELGMRRCRPDQSELIVIEEEATEYR